MLWLGFLDPEPALSRDPGGRGVVWIELGGLLGKDNRTKMDQQTDTQSDTNVHTLRRIRLRR